MFFSKTKISKIRFPRFIHAQQHFVCVFIPGFKKLYKNSGREIGTMHFSREELQRTNVTQDVEHYENSEQLAIFTFYYFLKCTFLIIKISTDHFGKLYSA